MDIAGVKNNVLSICWHFWKLELHFCVDKYWQLSLKIKYTYIYYQPPCTDFFCLSCFLFTVALESGQKLFRFLYNIFFKPKFFINHYLSVENSMRAWTFDIRYLISIVVVLTKLRSHEVFLENIDFSLTFSFSSYMI